MTYQLVQEQIIPKPLAEVFPFFEQPENLEKLTPPSLHFVIRTPSPIQMKTGALIEYTIRLYGIPFGWQTLIEGYQPPTYFCDRQLKGPYRLWRHQHFFEDQGNQTLMRDVVDYEIPFGMLGRIAHALFVQRQLQQIFAYRRETIRGIFV